MRQLIGESMTSGINVYSPWITVVTTLGVVSVDKTLCQFLVRSESPKRGKSATEFWISDPRSQRLLQTTNQ